MGRFEISAEDIAQGTLIKPGWWPFVVRKVEDKPAKEKATTTVTHVTCVFEKVENDEGQVVENVPVKAYFPDTNPGGVVNFCNAFGAGIGKTGGAVEIDESYVGKKAVAYVKRGEFGGRGTNNLADFRAL